MPGLNDEDNDNITENESMMTVMSIRKNELQNKRSNHLFNQNVPCIHLSYHLKVK